MSDLVCPVCGKSNPNTVEVCQYCGASLKRSSAASGTSDLPGWLKDIRKSTNAEPAATPDTTRPAQPIEPAGAKDVPFPDFLAGLSNLSDEEDDESPDWLNNLRGVLPDPPLIYAAPSMPRPAQPPAASTEKPPEQPAAPPAENKVFEQLPAAQPQAEPQTPNTDWLKAFDLPDSSGSVGSDIPDAEIDPAIYADLPDWMASLAGLGGQSTPAQPEPSVFEQSPAPANEPVDWLSSLGGDFTAEDNFATSESSAPVAGETPDWMARMSSSQAESGTVQNQPEPDWLASLSSSAVESGGMPGAKEDLQSSALLGSDDWSGLRGSTPGVFDASEGNNPNPGVSALDETPDWITNLQGSDPVSYEPDTKGGSSPAVSPFGELPDWMTNLRDPAATLEKPDWLANLNSSTPDQTSSANIPQAAETPVTPLENDNSAWLANLGGSALDYKAPVSGQTLESGQPAPFADQPDWLSSLQNSQDASFGDNPKQNQPESHETSFRDEVPDWLTSLQGISTPVDSVPAQAQPEPQSISDWKSAPSVPDEALKPNEPQTQNQPFEPEDLEGFSIPGGTGELPDWLARVSQATAVENKPVQGQVPAATAPKTPRQQANESGQSMIGTGQPVRPEVPGLASESGNDQNIDSIFSMETPDWLSNFLPAASQPVSAPSEKDSTPNDLPAAELPSWVQALRPMESVVEETSDNDEPQNVENEGPLAGLRSVLPTQPGLTVAKAPRAYANELLINETQHAQSALLENLINSEKNPQLLPKRPKVSRIQPVRWTIAAVLLLVVFIFAGLGSNVFPSPATPGETSAVGMFLNTVGNLPDNAPVLVIMDYQPGFAGEMESALGPVLENLMNKKARLAFVSTSPVGGLMADRLLSKFSTSYSYQIGQQYVKLGYLPGGAGGIKVFADQPATTLGQDTRSGNLWDTPVLKDVTINSVTSLANFAAVIVATDNPDIGRLWIEQAQPVLGAKPMLMVVSAQAEPMIQPYFQSGQISGLVTGMEGGLLYESALGKSGQARTYWDAYSAALLVAELIIIIGGFWSLRAGLRARRAGQEQDEV